MPLTPYLWGGLAGILLLGLLASLVGLHVALGAVANVEPAMRAAMIARGVAICFNTSALAVVMTIPGFFLTGIASALVRPLTPVRVKD